MAGFRRAHAHKRSISTVIACGGAAASGGDDIAESLHHGALNGVGFVDQRIERRHEIVAFQQHRPRAVDRPGGLAEPGDRVGDGRAVSIEQETVLQLEMTGGHGALPYFNAFMSAFMKGKPILRFPEPPPMPAEVRSLMERNKREELEKLEKAEQAGIRSGALTKPTPSADAPATDLPPGDTGDTTKPAVPDNPPALRPPAEQQKPPARKAEPSEEKPEGTKPKGKKGDG